MSTDLNRPAIVGTGIRSTVVAVVAVTIVFSIARASGDDLLVVPEFGSGEPKELKLWVALIATVIVGGFMGTALAWLTQRFTRRPRVAFLIVGVLGLIGYGILAAVRSEAASTAVWLNVMHLAVAIPIVGALAYALNPRRPRGTVTPTEAGLGSKQGSDETTIRAPGEMPELGSSERRAYG